MIFYILGNQITTLFLSMGILTTLSFSSPIESYIYGGSSKDALFKVTNYKRTLAIKLSNKKVKSNLLVITKDRKYYFNLAYSKDNPHQFVEIQTGSVGEFYTKSFEGKNTEILSGDKSILIVNKNNKPLNINGIKIKSKGYFSKGVPIMNNGNRLFN